ncbi:MAG TPA: acyltransferase [Polyangiales bacterium]|nr:acyltransferase [Polyangiales bacterium]
MLPHELSPEPALPPPEPQPVAPERIDALDGLRGLMACAVALYHLGILSRAFTPGGVMSSALAVLGLHSVEAFFMVSGFCLFHRHGAMPRGAAAVYAFQRQRFLRIAPVFYLTLLLHVACQTPVATSVSWTRLIENLTFSFGLHHPNRALVTGGWSIGLEYIFYFAFPWLALLWRSTALLCATTLAAIGFAWWHSANAVVGPDAARFNAYVLLQNHAFAFLAGGLLAKLRAHIRLRLPLWAACAALVVALSAWMASEPRVVDHFAVVLGRERVCYAAASCAIVGLFGLAHSTRARTQRWLRQLGDLSYPIYLLHPLAWPLALALLPAGVTPLWALCTALASTVLLAFLVHRYYERPIQRGLRVTRSAPVSRAAVS